MNTRQAMELLKAKMLAQDGLEATYRDNSLSVSLTVTRGQSLLSLSEPQGGSRVEKWDNDFFLDIDELLLGGVSWEPRVGALLDVTEEDGLIHRYELSQPSPQEPCARKVDSRTAYRVHTKFLEIVS